MAGLKGLIDRYVADLFSYAEENNQMDKYYNYALMLIRGADIDGMDSIPDELNSFLRLLSPMDIESVLYKFIDRAREKLSLLDVRIFSAVPLTLAQRTDIENKVVSIFGKETSVTMKVDPSLIGGIRIIAGNVVLDNTVKTRLAEMKKNIYKEVYLK